MSADSRSSRQWWWWLSFADEKFLGGVLFGPTTDDPRQMFREVRRAKLNPGGEARFFVYDADTVALVPDEDRNRLLNEAEAMATVRLIGPKGAA